MFRSGTFHPGRTGTDYFASIATFLDFASRISEAALRQNRVASSFPENPAVARGIVHGPKGEMIIAVTGTADLSPSNTHRCGQTTDRHQSFQCSRDTSIILRSTPILLKFSNDPRFSAARITRLREAEGHIFASMSFTRDCQLETNVRLVEFDADFQPKTLFESTSVNSLEIRDLQSPIVILFWLERSSLSCRRVGQ